MRIRLTTARVTKLSRDNRGDVVDVSPGEAGRLIATHQALPVDPETPLTHAVNVQTVVETAMLQPGIEIAGGRNKPKRR